MDLLTIWVYLQPNTSSMIKVRYIGTLFFSIAFRLLILLLIRTLEENYVSFGSLTVRKVGNVIKIARGSYESLPIYQKN